MTEMPEQEEAIFFKLGDKDSSIPAGKTVIEYTLAKLTTRDEKRILAEDINLKIKMCIRDRPHTELLLPFLCRRTT